MGKREEGAVRRYLKRAKLEGNVEGDCIDQAKACGWLARKMNGLGFRAWPDRLFIPSRARGTRFWVEFKRQGKDLTESQEKMGVDLRARGEQVYTVWTREEFEVIFLKHRREQRDQ